MGLRQYLSAIMYSLLQRSEGITSDMARQHCIPVLRCLQELGIFTGEDFNRQMKSETPPETEE